MFKEGEEMKKRGRPFGKSDFLEVDEMSKLLALPDKRTIEGKRDYAILVTLANTGMRKGELVKLKIGNIDFNNNLIHFNSLKKRGKGRGRERFIPLDENIIHVIQGYLNFEYNGCHNNRDLPLFRNLGKHGNCKKCSLTTKAVDCIVRKYVRKAKIQKRITPHSFRSTRATLLLDKGVNMATVRDLLDHEDVASTNEYLRTNQLRIKEAQDSLVFQ